MWELFLIRQVIRKIVELKCNFKIRLPTIAKINFTTWYWFMLRFTTKKKKRKRKKINYYTISQEARIQLGFTYPNSTKEMPGL